MILEMETFDDKQLDDLRGRARRLIDDEKLTRRTAATESGIKYGTLANWLSGNYQGDNNKVAANVRIWLDAREENERVRRAMPELPQFVSTPSATRFIEVLRYAQIMPEIGVIAGAAGTGKTTAAEYYAATNPNVWMSTMEPCTASVYTMLGEIAEVMGVTEKVQMKLSRAIGRVARNSEGLIIVDEAQHLSVQALDQLRSLYDRYRVGIALVGNETVYSRLEGEGRKASFAQLFSRIGMRVTHVRPKPGDIEAMLAACGIEDKAEVKLLKQIGNKPGGLRSLTRVVRMASMLAAGAKEERKAKHFMAAWERLSGVEDAA